MDLLYNIGLFCKTTENSNRIHSQHREALDPSLFCFTLYYPVPYLTTNWCKTGTKCEVDSFVLSYGEYWVGLTQSKHFFLKTGLFNADYHLMGLLILTKNLFIILFIFNTRFTGSRSSKYKHGWTSALLCNIRNTRICMRENLSFL